MDGGVVATSDKSSAVAHWDQISLEIVDRDFNLIASSDQENPRAFLQIGQEISLRVCASPDVAAAILTNDDTLAKAQIALLEILDHAGLRVLVDFKQFSTLAAPRQESREGDKIVLASVEAVPVAYPGARPNRPTTHSISARLQQGFGGPIRNTAAIEIIHLNAA